VIPTKETTYKLPSCPASLALLSDLHNTDPTPILSSLRSHRPSLICITGDVLYGSRPEGDVSPLETQTNVLPFLTACASIAPTFLSLGNHEWMADAEDLRLLSSTGVIVLDNEWRSINIDGQEIAIAGLTSAYVTDYRSFRAESGSPDRYPRQESISGIGGAVHARDHKPETGWLEAYCSTPGFHILLSHHPEYLPFIPASVDLILSGHAHGGQWRVFNHGVWAPGQGWWPRWTKGVNEGRLVVSTGLSNTTWIPRIWNPTEVVYLEP
jgi:predicted MPP superfamily phosphohydrolase